MCFQFHSLNMSFYIVMHWKVSTVRAGIFIYLLADIAPLFGTMFDMHDEIKCISQGRKGDT